MSTARWILVLPAAVAAWLAVFIAGVWTFNTLERALCPAGEWVSGTCMNGRVQIAMTGVVLLFIALSAVAVVLAAVLVAPREKLLVAWFTFAAGSGLAVLLTVAGESPEEGAAAIAAGLLTVLWLRRRLRRPSDRTTATPG